MASVTTSSLVSFGSTAESVTWNTNVSLGSIFSASGQNLTLALIRLYTSGSNAGRVFFRILLGREFTTAFEATGRIILNHPNRTLEVRIANADMTEPYFWTPANSAEVITFGDYIRGLSTSKVITLTLTDEPLIPTMKHNGKAATAWKYNGKEISAAKYNGVVLL